MILTCVTAVFNAIKSGNRENLIRCVKSVAALKTEHEHLIYDGASTDGTVEVLRELERTTPGLKVVSEPDTGIYNALNKGVRDAKGEWFYVLGCDDYICRPEVMDELLRNIQDEDIIATDAYLGTANSKKIGAISFEKTLWHTPYCHQGTLMRLNVIQRQHGFDEAYRIAADYKLLLACHLANDKVLYLPGAHSMYACFGMDGTSETSKEAMFCEFDRILSEFFHLKCNLMKKYRERRFLPARVFVRFLCSDDIGLRVSARKMFTSFLRYYTRLILYPLVVITRPIRCHRNHK